MADHFALLLAVSVFGLVLNLVTGHGRSREEANEDRCKLMPNEKGQKLVPNKMKPQHEPSDTDAART